MMSAEKKARLAEISREMQELVESKLTLEQSIDAKRLEFYTLLFTFDSDAQSTTVL